MLSLTEQAFAKLNISLDVVGRRDDGYHDLVMVMQTISLCDEITLTLKETPGIEAVCNFHYIPTDERNLAVRAAACFLRAAGLPEQGVKILVKKNIPVGTGMAGGSADAAAVLRGMNLLFGTPFSRKKLEELAQEIGSDVAFCIAGGTALARGRGEILQDLVPFPDCTILVCKPEFSISTPELFRKIDQAPVRIHPDTEGLLAALERRDLRGICIRMYNVFEDVDDRRMRTVKEIKSTMLDHGALGTIMTGTGSAVFGVYAEETGARNALKALKKEYRFCRLASPVPRLSIEKERTE